MTPHLHRSYVAGCYRCDLNRDEVEHPADDDCPDCEGSGSAYRGCGSPLGEDCPTCGGTGTSGRSAADG